MTNRIFRLGLGLLLAGLASSALAAATPDAALAPRGAYVARAADCAACHTAPGGKPYAGGYAIASPLGAIYATNITPSKNAGIGNWSEAQFARAVREGVAADGHRLYPAMPYAEYSGMTDEDVHALYAYLITQVAPVDKAPTQRTQLGFPYNLRSLMAGWNLLFLDRQRNTPAAGASPQLARGRYLVDVLGHCGSCHTPRNLFMASDRGAYLAGGDVDGWHAPNLTSDPVSGIGGWSEDELAGFLRNGHAPGKAQAAGGMAEAVEHSLRYLSDDDLHAIAAYLKSVPAKARPGQTQPAYTFGQTAERAYDFDNAQSATTLAAIGKARAAAADVEAQRSNVAGVTDGAILFDSACASCHQPSGSGTADHYYPSLFHNTVTGAATPNNLVMAILRGVSRQGADGAAFMPGFAGDMDDGQVAAVANFVAAHFGNPALTVTAGEVAQLRVGGPAPAIQRAMPWLMGGAILVVLLAIALAARLVRRKRSP